MQCPHLSACMTAAGAAHSSSRAPYDNACVFEGGKRGVSLFVVLCVVYVRTLGFGGLAGLPSSRRQALLESLTAWHPAAAVSQTHYSHPLSHLKWSGNGPHCPHFINLLDWHECRSQEGSV